MMMDELNARILGLLERDGRMSYHDIALALNRSDSTVRDRIQRLERDGVVRGYSAHIDWSKLGYNSRALVSCTPNGSKAEFIAALCKHPNVDIVYSTSGARQTTFAVRSRDNQELDLFLQRHVVPLGLTELKVEPIVDVTIPAFEGRREAPPQEAPPAPTPAYGYGTPYSSGEAAWTAK